MNNEKALLNLFVSDDEHRPSITSPFLQHGKVCATDGRNLIRINAALCENTYPETVNDRTPPNTETVIPAPTCNEKLTQKMLSDAWAKAPEKEKDRTCPECGGNGVVYWHYHDRDGKHYTHWYDCPVCEGTGYISDYKPITCQFTINGCYLVYGHIELLSNVMKYLEVDTLILRHAEMLEHRVTPMLLGVEDKDIEIVIMPQVPGEDTEEIPIL